jgi:hypothetical protein
MRPFTNPGVILVVLCNLDPDIDHTILKILEVPEQRLMNPGVGVPPLVLSSGECMHVEDGVQPFGGASLHDAVDEAEALGPDNRRVAVVHEVPVVYRDADAVESQRGEEFRV